MEMKVYQQFGSKCRTMTNYINHPIRIDDYDGGLIQSTRMQDQILKHFVHQPPFSFSSPSLPLRLLLFLRFLPLHRLNFHWWRIQTQTQPDLESDRGQSHNSGLFSGVPSPIGRSDVGGGEGEKHLLTILSSSP